MLGPTPVNSTLEPLPLTVTPVLTRWTVQKEVFSGIMRTEENDALSLPLEDTTRSFWKPGLTPSNIVSSPGGPERKGKRYIYPGMSERGSTACPSQTCIDPKLNQCAQNPGYT